MEEADEMDEITKKALLRRDIPHLRTMDNDYMDSPVSIITLLTAMDEIGANNQQIIAHDNSARISRSGFDNTTSYFTVVYW
jgi:putative N-acetylmannosamine-6-phosphate epimerase